MQKNDNGLENEGLKKDLENYTETKIDLIKLKAIEKTGTIGGNVIAGICFSFLGNYFLFFSSIAGGFALSNLFDSYILGFACVALFYGILAALIMIFKTRLITFPIITILLKKIYYKEKDDQA